MWFNKKKPKMTIVNILKEYRDWKKSVEEYWVPMGGSRKSFEIFRRLPMQNHGDYAKAIKLFIDEFQRIGALKIK